MRKLAVFLVVTGLSLVSASPALAVRSDRAATVPASVDAANWLAAQVTPGGYIESSWTPGTPDISTTEQAVLALAAAGVGSAQVTAMEDYLEANVADAVQSGGVDSPQRIGFLILGAVAAGRNPLNFGGQDLVARLAATLQPSGLYGSASATYDGTFRQSIALLALSAANVSAPTEAVDWLRDQQCASGGWQSFRADTSVPCGPIDPASFSGPDTNSTALAVMALHDLVVTPNVDPGPWFDATRTSGGGWTIFSTPDGVADANSTGLVLQALLALRDSQDAQGEAALQALQVPCSGAAADRGGIAYQPDPSDGALYPDTLATTQAIWGMAGALFPLPAVALAPAEAPCQVRVEPTTTTTTTVVAPTTTATTLPAVAPAATTPPPAAEALPLTGGGVAGIDDVTLAGIGGVVLLAGLVLVGASRRRSAA